MRVVGKSICSKYERVEELQITYNPVIQDRTNPLTLVFRVDLDIDMVPLRVIIPDMLPVRAKTDDFPIYQSHPTLEFVLRVAVTFRSRPTFRCPWLFRPNDIKSCVNPDHSRVIIFTKWSNFHYCLLKAKSTAKVAKITANDLCIHFTAFGDLTK